MKAFLRRARGASNLEYAIVLGVVALSGIAAFEAFGKEARDLAEREGECVRTFTCGEGSPFPESGGSGAPAGGGGPPPGSNGAPAGKPKGGGGFITGAYDFGKGVVMGGVDTVVGAYEVVRHPIDTANGLVYAAQNPGAAWNAIKAEWQGRSGAENAGRAVFEAVSTFGPGAVVKLGKASAVAAKAGEAAKAADAAALAARAAEKTRLGEGAFSVAYKQGDNVLKEIKDTVPGVGDVPTKLSQADRARLADTTAELTNEVGSHMPHGMVPKMEHLGDGTLKQPYVEGQTIKDLQRGGDWDAVDRAQRAMDEATGTAAKGIGLDGPYGYLETPDGWRAKIDTNAANFRFDAKGNITSWFDPVAVYPKAP